jgi:hypothetical protein
MTAIKNFIRGDTRDLVFTFVQSDGVTPVDLSGALVSFTINADEEPDSDSSAVLQKDTTSHTDPDGGISTITLTNADTNTIAPGDYWYDVQCVDAGGIVLSSKRDAFQIIGDITRRTSIT